MTERVPHLLVYISGHGYGHVAQTGPVLNRLREFMPELRLTICSTVPHAHLQSRIHGAFEHIVEETDFGMKMASALDVLPEASLAAYEEFHRGWEYKVEQEAHRISTLAPDLVLSNVAYLPLEAARHAGVTSLAMCSLNWMDIFDHYCGEMPGASDILDVMHEAYSATESFLRLEPGMEMAGLDNICAIGPIARLGRNRRIEINERLGLAHNDQLVLVSMGGIATRSPMASWPEMGNVRWLASREWYVPRKDVYTLEQLGMDFTDVLHSCDAILCKPGYGSFTEAVCNGTPVAYVSREDWPEEPDLVAWLAQNGNSMEIARSDFEAGAFGRQLQRLMEQSRPAPIAPSGIDDAAAYLLRSMSIASP